MDDLLPTAEGDVPALRNCLGFGPWWGQSGGHRWKWEFVAEVTGGRAVLLHQLPALLTEAFFLPTMGT